ncbi:MAG: hypothetical protein P8176_11860 [Gammaproteobacteria bacterium]
MLQGHVACVFCHKPQADSTFVVMDNRSGLDNDLIRIGDRLTAHEVCLTREIPKRFDGQRDYVDMSDCGLGSRSFTMEEFQRMLLGASGTCSDAGSRSRDVQPSMSGARSPGSMLYLAVIRGILRQKDSVLAVPLKIAFLQKLLELSDDATRTYVGNRHLLPLQAGLYGVELAFQQSPPLNDSLRSLATALLAHLPENYRFTLCGISRSTKDLRDWSMGRNLPGEHLIDKQHVLGCIASSVVDGRMSRWESVQSSLIVERNAQRMREMLARIGGPDQVLSIAAVTQGIESSLSTADERRSVKPLMDLILNSSMQSSFYSETVSFGVRLLWTYINRSADPHMKRNLQAALVSRLQEIERERPCAAGCMGRILDVPSGIDLSLDGGVADDAQLKHEIQIMAAEVSDGLENFSRGYIDQLEQDFAACHLSGDDPTVMVSQLKRDMLIEKAKQELVHQRQLPLPLVMRLVDAVFPEGAVI